MVKTRGIGLVLLLLASLLVAYLGMPAAWSASDPTIESLAPTLPEVSAGIPAARQHTEHLPLRSQPDSEGTISREPLGPDRVATGERLHRELARISDGEQEPADRGRGFSAPGSASRLPAPAPTVEKGEATILEGDDLTLARESDLAPEELAEQPALSPQNEPWSVVADADIEEMYILKQPQTQEPLEPPEIGTLPRSGKALLVDQLRQEMTAYENGQVVRIMPVSTGMPIWNRFTPSFRGHVGSYRETMWAFGRIADHAWHLFVATGDILIHGAPYALVDGIKMYSELDALGVRPSSLGCIRLHPGDAEWLVEWDPVGVPIEITRWPGEIDWETGRSVP